MLNIFETARQAASEFGLSMKDDPTLWPAGSEITPEIVRKTCNAAALENARSALSRALGKIAETVATEMDVEIANDGPLADLDAVLALHVEDGPDFDLSAVAAAPDWQARVEAVREAFGIAVHGYHIPPLPIIDLLHYANSDERLNGDIRRGIAALRGPEHDKLEVPGALLVNNGGDEWDEPDAEVKDEPDAVDLWAEPELCEDEGCEHHGTPHVCVTSVAPKRERGKPSPGKARRTKAEIAEDEAADAMQQRIRDSEAKVLAPMVEAVKAIANGGQTYVDADAMDDWDDEPASQAPAPALDTGRDDAEPTATAANLPGLASAAGIADGEMATLLGMSKGYYSQVRNGKRPWPGLKPDQVQRLRAELAGRREAIDAVEAALSTADVLKPEGA